jgi:uncharacterized protein YegP (UPF0339 family)
MPGKFELSKAKDGEFRFVLKGGNGEIILTSELYKHKESAEKGVASVKKNAPEDKRYERKTSHNGKPFFVLKAGNHEVIGTSQMYKNAASMEEGIAAVKANAARAEIVEVKAAGK